MSKRIYIDFSSTILWSKFFCIIVYMLKKFVPRSCPLDYSITISTTWWNHFCNCRISRYYFAQQESISRQRSDLLEREFHVLVRAPIFLVFANVRTSQFHLQHPAAMAQLGPASHPQRVSLGDNIIKHFTVITKAFVRVISGAKLLGKRRAGPSSQVHHKMNKKGGRG